MLLLLPVLPVLRGFALSIRCLQLLEHALGPYARGERNTFSAPLHLTTDHTAVAVESFDELLGLYHGQFSLRHGADPEGWQHDDEAQKLVQELTAKFLQAAEPDFRIAEEGEVGRQGGA